MANTKITTNVIADDAITSAKLDTNIAIAGTLGVTGNITGTLATAAQTNITSVGTLTALTGGTGDLNWDSGTLFVDSSANAVGIGTSSPARTLSINATSPTLQLCNSTTGTSAENGFELAVAGDTAYIMQREDANMIFGTNNTERMRIDSSGNVGIGCTPTATANVTTLEISNSTTARILVDSTGTGGRKYGWYSSTDGQFAVYDYDASAERMRISSSGQVSIGTTSTTAPLRVKVATDANFAVQNTSSTVQLQGINDAANAFATIDIAGNPIKFSANGSESMRIDSSGRVGIAQDAPADFNAAADDLVIGNSSGDFGMTIRTGTASNGSIHFADGTTGDGPNRGIITYDHSDDHMHFNVAAAEKMRIKSDGQITTQGDILPGADVIMANGRGISFAATSDAGGMTSELLDDYEEGTWTPVLTTGTGSISYSYRAASYRKVGSVVSIIAGLGLSGVSSPTGNLSITGLPFTNGGGEAHVASVSFSVLRNFSQAYDQFRGYVDNGGTSISLAVNHENTGHSYPGSNTLTASTQIYFSVTYHTA